MQFFTSTGEKAAVAPVRAYIDHVVKAEYTLALFSPDAMQGTSASSVARMLAEQGLEVVSMPALHFDAPTVERFFQAQATMEDAIGFVNYMSSHPLYALIIRAPAAVERLKKLLGHPQQDLAAPGTIRQMLWPKFSYPQAVYGSASAEQGQKDVDFILSLMAPQDAQAVERDFRPYQQRNFAQAN
jgi:nucleoside diphosphate kinase